MKLKCLPEMEDDAELLKVGSDGSINPDPLAKWQLRFYPEPGQRLEV